MVSPGLAAFTAAWMVLNVAVATSQFPATAIPSSSTTAVVLACAGAASENIAPTNAKTSNAIDRFMHSSLASDPFARRPDKGRGGLNAGLRACGLAGLRACGRFGQTGL